MRTTNEISRFAVMAADLALTAIISRQSCLETGHSNPDAISREPNVAGTDIRCVFRLNTVAICVVLLPVEDVMFNRNEMPSLRDFPSEAEMAYVRALLLPLERKFPSKEKTRRIFPPRPLARLSDVQLLTEHQKGGPACVILVRLTQDRLANQT